MLNHEAVLFRLAAKARGLSRSPRPMSRHPFQNDVCSDLMCLDTNLGENARHGEVFDEQAETYVFPGVQTADGMPGTGSMI